MKNKKLGLLGAGAQAKEIADFITSSGGSVDFFAVQKNYIKKSDLSNVIDINNPSEVERITHVVSAVGAPLIKKYLIDEWSGEEYGQVISDNTWISDKGVKLGEDVVIAPGSQITTGVEVGNHVLINIGSSVSHDAVIGSFSTISPGVHIGGRVIIGEGVFLGIGSTIKNDVKISNGIVVGAGAVVIGDLTEENGVYVGVPAKLIHKNTHWMHEV